MDQQKSADRLRPLFIGGVGRSGTTILKRVLSLHPQIVSLRDELRVITDPDGVLNLEHALTENWSQYNGDIAVQRFRKLIKDCSRGSSKLAVAAEKSERILFRKIGISPRRYLGAGFSQQFGKERVMNALNQLTSEISFHHGRGSWTGSRSFQMPDSIYETEPMDALDLGRKISNFIETLYSGLPRADEAVFWLDDTPLNLIHADHLLRLFPDMRLMHIYRDPRDVLSSNISFTWGGDNVEAAARRIAATFSRWEKVKQALPKEVFVEVSLEELAHSPGKVLEGIRNLTGLECGFEFGDISPDKVNSARWQHDLTTSQQKLAEKYLGKYIEAYTR